MPLMGAVNLPVVWSIPDPRRKAPLAGGWKYRKITIKQETDRFLGRSLRSSALPNSWTGFVKVIVTAGWRKKIQPWRNLQHQLLPRGDRNRVTPSLVGILQCDAVCNTVFISNLQNQGHGERKIFFLLADRQKIFAEFDKKFTIIQPPHSEVRFASLPDLCSLVKIIAC